MESPENLVPSNSYPTNDPAVVARNQSIPSGMEIQAMLYVALIKNKSIF